MYINEPQQNPTIFNFQRQHFYQHNHNNMTHQKKNREEINKKVQLKLLLFLFWTIFKHICLTCLFRVQNILIMITTTKSNWIIDVDIESHLLALHSHLNEIIVSYLFLLLINFCGFFFLINTRKAIKK